MLDLDIPGVWWQTGGRPSPLALDAVLAAVADAAPVLERLAISGSCVPLHSCGASTRGSLAARIGPVSAARLLGMTYSIRNAWPCSLGGCR